MPININSNHYYIGKSNLIWNITDLQYSPKLWECHNQVTQIIVKFKIWIYSFIFRTIMVIPNVFEYWYFDICRILNRVSCSQTNFFSQWEHFLYLLDLKIICKTDPSIYTLTTYKLTLRTKLTRRYFTKDAMDTKICIHSEFTVHMRPIAGTW